MNLFNTLKQFEVIPNCNFEHFTMPKGSLCPVAAILFSLLYSGAPNNLLCISMNLDLQDLVQSHIVILCIGVLSLHSAFEAHSCCSVGLCFVTVMYCTAMQHFIPLCSLLQSQIVLHSMDILYLFISFSLEGHQGCFNFVTAA